MTLSYELCKELFKEGFPMKHGWSVGVQDGELIDREYNQPTLSELISACGEGNFQSLHVSGLVKGEWVAEQWQGDKGFFMCGKEGRGKTPEEAVARLYLALKAGTPAQSS